MNSSSDSCLQSALSKSIIQFQQGSGLGTSQTYRCAGKNLLNIRIFKERRGGGRVSIKANEQGGSQRAGIYIIPARLLPNKINQVGGDK
jgi:hypothetical protein